MPARESEAVIVARKGGKTVRSEGPLLPSRVQSEERWPDCPREGRLYPGRSGESGWTTPANCSERYTEWPKANLGVNSPIYTTTCIEPTSWRKPGCAWRAT